MATDFFERQAQARRWTKRLVVLFVLAVVAILITTFLVTAFFVEAQQVTRGGASKSPNSAAVARRSPNDWEADEFLPIPATSWRRES